MGAVAEHGRDHSLDGEAFPGPIGVGDDAEMWALGREYRELLLATAD
jgi:hypothetical protein